MAHPDLKLTYFNVKARAEPIRLALAIGGIPFTDRRIEFKDMAQLKPSFPFKQIPILEINGQVFAQTLPILRYVGTLANLHPAEPLQALQVDAIMEAVSDINNSIFDSMREKDATKKGEMRAHLATVSLPAACSDLNAYIHGQPYAVGDKLTIADLDIYVFVAWIKSDMLDGIPKDLCDSYAKMMAVHDIVKSHSKVQQWEKEHQ